MADNKQLVTIPMLRQTLKKAYAFGWGDMVCIFLGALLIGTGIATLAILVGIPMLIFGGVMIWGVISGLLKWKGRREKIRQGQFYLSTQKVRGKEIREGDGDTVDTSWIYLDAKDAYPVEDADYAIIQEGDVVYLLYLEGETNPTGRYYPFKHELDEQVQALVR